jgi:dTDP-4-dehydrorhamnose reductase
MLGTDLVRTFGTSHEVFGVDIDELDIRDLQQCNAFLRDVRPAVTICAAALTAVDYCETHEAEALNVNGEAPGHLAAAAAAVGSPIVHYSTDYVYDGRKAGPYFEDDQPNPLSAYGRSKLLGDRNVQLNNPKHLILRTSWVFGPNGKNFVRTVVAAARDRKPLRVVIDQRGRPSYTRDLSELTMQLVERGCTGLYHVTNEGSCSWFELARHALDCAGMSDADVAPVATGEYPLPAPRPSNSVLANTRLLREGVAPLRHWREAVAEYVRDFLCT